MTTTRRRGRHPVKVPAHVADYYRAEAERRDRHTSLILLEELEAAIAAVERGERLPAPRQTGRPPRDRQAAQEVESMVQMKWTQDDAVYETYKETLRRAGSSVSAVLRNPRQLRAVTVDTGG